MTVLSKNQTVAGASCPVTAGPGTLGFTGPTMIRPNNPDRGRRRDPVRSNHVGIKLSTSVELQTCQVVLKMLSH